MSERQVLKILFYSFLISTSILGLSVFVLSGVAIYRLKSEKESQKQAQIYETVTRPINLTERILLLLGGGTTLIAGLREIQLNRRNSAHEFLVSNILDKALKIRDKLAERDYDIYQRALCLNTAITTGDNKYLIISFLNYLDYMCIAADNKIIDEELIEDSAKYLILKSWTYFEQAIRQFREVNEAPHAWNKIEKWIQKSRSSATPH